MNKAWAASFVGGGDGGQLDGGVQDSQQYWRQLEGEQQKYTMATEVHVANGLLFWRPEIRTVGFLFGLF